jgi:hypothetical protein
MENVLNNTANREKISYSRPVRRVCRSAIAKKEPLPLKSGQEQQLLPGKELHAQTYDPPITDAAQPLADAQLYTVQTQLYSWNL